MDYNDFETQKDKPFDENVEEETQKDEWFLFQWGCAPSPGGAGDQVTWFDDPAMLADFVRHRLLWDAAVDMFADDMPEEECSVEEIIAASAFMSEERSYLKENLLHCLALADAACAAPKDEIIPKVRECLAYYNKKFNRNPYGGWDEGADLVHGIDELKEFWSKQEHYCYCEPEVECILGD